jgi:methanogenic corrinoid protein MtbC1
MTTPKTQASARHPIGVVSSRTGLPQDLIRAWERRYQAVSPRRGENGRRLYADADIEKLRLLRRAVAAGRRISDVAGLDTEQLRAIVNEDREASTDAPRKRRLAPADATVFLEEAVAALESLDRHRLEHTLNEASIQMGGPALRQQVIVPLLNIIGDRWQEGSLRIMHEHLASTIVRSFMTPHRNGTDHAHIPRIVITTPAGQHHELGALMAAAVAEESGWDVYYLGPNLPAEEIAAAARLLEARAVALSVSYRDGDRAGNEILRLRGMIPDVPIFVGGRAGEVLRDRLNGEGIACPDDLSTFRNELAGVLA